MLGRDTRLERQPRKPRTGPRTGDFSTVNEFGVAMRQMPPTIRFSRRTMRPPGILLCLLIGRESRLDNDWHQFRAEWIDFAGVHFSVLARSALICGPVRRTAPPRIVTLFAWLKVMRSNEHHKEQNFTYRRESKAILFVVHECSQRHATSFSHPFIHFTSF